MPSHSDIRPVGLFPALFQDDVLRLETRRLWLRWPVAADAPHLQDIAARETLARPSARWPHALEPGDAARRIGQARAANADGDGLVLVLAYKAAPDAPIGVIGVAPDREVQGVLQIAFLLDVPHQGQGLMTEAVRALAGAVFRFTQTRTIRAAGGVANMASRRVLEKAGFRPIGSRATGQRPSASAAGTAGSSLELTRESWAGGCATAPPLFPVDDQRAAASCGCAA